MPNPEAIPLNAAGREIEKRSMAVIDAEVPEPRPFSGEHWLVVRRMIHSCADFELLDLVRFHPQALPEGLAALRRGCAIIADTRMVAAGLPARLYDPLGCRVHCLIADPRTLHLASSKGTTRAAAAVDVAAGEHQDAIWVVGNAPTALLRLIHLARLGQVRPALIVGMPVGFVQAAESKEALLEWTRTPFIVVRGRKGGSAPAAAALNALAMIAAGR